MVVSSNPSLRSLIEKISSSNATPQLGCVKAMVSLNTMDSVGRGMPDPLVTDCCTAFMGAVVGVGAGADDINLEALGDAEVALVSDGEEACTEACVFAFAELFFLAGGLIAVVLHD